MNSYDELKAEMKAIQQMVAKVKKKVHTNKKKEVDSLYKKFVFTANMLKSSLAVGLKKS